MTKETFTERLNTLKEEYEHAKKAILIEYASANNPYKRGDTLTDRRGTTVVVDKIGLYLTLSNYTGSYPECYYEGVELTKRGVPFKDGRRSKIYQSDVIQLK